MQWGQIKTLFILSFLVLDLFLLQQFLTKQSQEEVAGQLATVAEDITTELEERNITIEEGIIEDEAPPVNLITSSGIGFPEDILTKIESLEDSETHTVELVENNTVLKASLSEPVEVTEDNVITQVASVVPFSDQYSYWGWDEDQGVALFFQKVNDRTVYFNKGGILLVKIENEEITGYGATFLSFNPPSEGTESNLQPKLNIVKQLVDAGKINSGDTVTSMNIGYHTSINLTPGEENGPQQFAPTWKVTVNESENYFIYAITGNIVDIPEDEFIEETKNAFNITESVLDR